MKTRQLTDAGATNAAFVDTIEFLREKHARCTTELEGMLQSFRDFVLETLRFIDVLKDVGLLMYTCSHAPARSP